MKKSLIAAVFAAVVLFGASVQAQTAVQANKLYWDITGANLAEASGNVYKIYIDGAATGATLAGVVCTGTASPFTCSAPLPTFTVGSHSVTLTTTQTINGSTVEGSKSAAFAFTIVVVPTPTNLRVGP